MKPVRIILFGLVCGISSTAHADIASVQYVQSIISNLEPPTINNAILTIQKNGTTVDTFTANAAADKTINITVPTTAAEVNAVPTTRTVNGEALSSDVTLDGADIELTGYSKAGSASAVATSDTINSAIGKLEYKVDNAFVGNAAITASGSTNKIVQYDAKGLVVAGTDAGALATKDTISNTDVASNAAIDQSKIANLTTDLAAKQDIQIGSASDVGKAVVVDANGQIAMGSVLGTAAYTASSDYVPTTRTVNGEVLSSNVTLDGADIALTGYSMPASTSAITANDTINAAIGKLEKGLLPVGTTSGTVAAGDDARFDSVSTTQPSGTPPTGRVWVWFN